jgi:hypothetical protein
VDVEPAAAFPEAPRWGRSSKSCLAASAQFQVWKRCLPDKRRAAAFSKFRWSEGYFCSMNAAGAFTER